ncbi:MAG: ATP synthase F1 subunit epsilon [Oscillospiraceae bacterium]|nr:ATP synthase F1 subunit epsilon [Oscillospiraceae bacterium]
MKNFSLQIVTPEGGRFDGEAQMIRLRTIEGDVAVMAGHVPYATAVGVGECRVVLPDGSERLAACCGGLFSVGSTTRLIAATFEWAEDIDTDRARAACQRAQDALAAGSLDAAQKASLQERLRRAELRLRVAETVDER